MLSFRDCAMPLEEGTAEPGSASDLLPGRVSQAQTLLAPCFLPCPAPPPQAEYGRGLLQSLEPQGPAPDGAALVSSIPEPVRDVGSL